MSGGGGGGSTKTTTQIDPKMMALYQQNYQRAQDVADTPFQPYTDQRFAPLNALQNQAIDQAQANAGLLSGGLGSAYNALQAGLDPSVRDVSTQPITALDTSQYMNPYTDQVINNSLNDLNRARQMAIGRGEDQALAAGAYGGSREGVADSLTNQAFAQQAANLSGQLRAQGFNNAQTLAQQLATGNATRDLQAQQLNQNADALRSQLQGQTAQGLLNLGLNAPSMLSQAGAQQQNQAQQGLDFAYQQWLAQQQKPYQDVGLLNSVLSGPPTGSTKIESQPGGSGLSGALGGAMAGAKLGTGSGGPGWGTAIGAGVGGLLGFFG